MRSRKSALDSMRGRGWDWGLLVLLAGAWGWFEWYPYGDWVEAGRGCLLGAGVWAVLQAIWGLFGPAADEWEDRRIGWRPSHIYGCTFLESPLASTTKEYRWICETCWVFKKPGCPVKSGDKNRPGCAHWNRLTQKDLSGGC